MLPAAASPEILETAHGQVGLLYTPLREDTVGAGPLLFFAHETRRAKRNVIGSAVRRVNLSGYVSATHRTRASYCRVGTVPLGDEKTPGLRPCKSRLYGHRNV